MLLEQREIVKSAISNIQHSRKQHDELTTGKDEIKSVLYEITRAVKELSLNRRDNLQPFVLTSDSASKKVSFKVTNTS